MTTQAVRWLLSTAFVLGLGLAHAQEPQPPHQQAPATSSAGMPAKCKAMAADRDKMMADMNAADQRLDELVAKMNQASGQAKADAVASVVTEMVAQRKTMRSRMMQMHQQMMGHMGEHMQAGAQSMATCPMMRMGPMQP